MKQTSAVLPEMDALLAERDTAIAAAAVKEVEDLMRRPLTSISAAAGNMERNVPLFFGMGNNPTLF